MTDWKAWLKASRLPSQSYIFFPLLLGEMIAFCRLGQFDWGIFAFIHLFGVAIQLYIVYANDYADFEVDALNVTYTIFSGGSRVLVDGNLSRTALKHGAWAMAGTTIGIAVVLAIGFARVAAPLFVLLALFLLYAYSFPPIRLSYRGGGEFLQMIGVGVVLPLFSYYAQTGTLQHFPAEVFCLLLPTNLACAIATSLPDEPSDRQGQKRTVSVLLGNRNAKSLILGLNTLTVVQSGVLGIMGQPEMSDVALMALMALVLLVLICTFPQALPGTRRLSLFVFFSILLTILITGTLAWLAYQGDCTLVSFA